MLYTIPTNPTAPVNALMRDTQKHLRQHGSSLCNLLDIIDEPSGIDALCDLYAALDTASPDAAKVEAPLQEIERFLAKQAPSELDLLGREWNFYAAEAARWHGARLSELVARFRNTG